MTGDEAEETAELLTALIRNRCVNDGTPGSGQEWRNADVLAAVLGEAGMSVERFEPASGRVSLVARIEGSHADAPSLCLMGHTDVVPVNPAGWTRDPFGAERVGGEIWGRGAVDMLNLTAGMAVAVRRLAASGWRPRGTLIYLAVADEEAGSTYGASWLAAHAADAVRCDYVLTESDGILMPHPDGVPRITATFGEKGVAWRRLRVRGTPGHGSMPYGADNALVTMAEVVAALADYRPAARIEQWWLQYVQTLGLPAEVAAALADPATAYQAAEALPPGQERLAKLCHACTHTTFSPNVGHGGVKANVIPDRAEIDLDTRLAPGDTVAEVSAHLQAALGPRLAAAVEVDELLSFPPTTSPLDTPLWHAMERAVQGPYPGARLLPRVAPYFTDAREFRHRLGAVAYGFGLFSPGVTYEDVSTRYHGHDERIDIASLGLSTRLWIDIARDLLG